MWGFFVDEVSKRLCWFGYSRNKEDGSAQIQIHVPWSPNSFHSSLALSCVYCGRTLRLAFLDNVIHYPDWTLVFFKLWPHVLPSCRPSFIQCFSLSVPVESDIYGEGITSTRRTAVWWDDTLHNTCSRVRWSMIIHTTISIGHGTYYL